MGTKRKATARLVKTPAARAFDAAVAKARRELFGGLSGLRDDTPVTLTVESLRAAIGRAVSAGWDAAMDTDVASRLARQVHDLQRHETRRGLKAQQRGNEQKRKRIEKEDAAVLERLRCKKGGKHARRCGTRAQRRCEPLQRNTRSRPSE